MEQGRSAQAVLFQDFICETDVMVVVVLRYYCDSGPELNKLFIFQRAEADFVVCKSHLSFSLCLEYLVGISPQGGGGPGQSFLSGLVGGVVWCGLFSAHSPLLCIIEKLT